ncbi:MAG: hypothetical protein WD023_11705 [Ilumatobacteraceae bacterium]
MDKRPTRTDEDELGRRIDILDAARRVLDRSEMDGFTLDDVTAELGLATGTLDRSVPTREALLLALTADEYTVWFDRLDREVPASSDVAATVVAACMAQPRLLRLLSVSASVLGRTVPVDTAHEFEATLIARRSATAALLAERLPTTVAGARRLLLHVHASAVGLYHHAIPTAIGRQSVAGPIDATEPEADLELELLHAVRALVAAVPVIRQQVARRRDR